MSDTQGSYDFYVLGLYQVIYVHVMACLSSSGSCDSVLDTYSLKYTSPPNYPAQEFTLQGANNTRLKLGLDVLCPFEPPSCPLGNGLMNASMDFVQFTNQFNDVSCANSPSCDVKFEICVGLNPDSCDLMMRTEIIPSQYNRGYHRSISDTQGSYNFYVTGLYQVIYVNVTACLSSSGYCDSILDTYSLKYESPASYPALNFTLQGTNDTRLKLGFDVTCPIKPPACPLGDGLMDANMNFIQFINPFSDVSCANSPSCDVKFEICVGLTPDSCDLMMRTEIIPSQYNRGYLRNMSDTQGSYDFYVAGLYKVIYVNVTACLSNSGYCDSVLDTYSLKYNSPPNYPAQEFTLQGANNTRLKLGLDVSCPIEPPACPLADGLMNASMNFIQFTNPLSDVSCANSSSCDVKFEICVGLNPDSCDLMMRTELISSQYNRGYLRNMSDAQGFYDFYVLGLYQVIYVNVKACLSSSGSCDSVLDTYSLKYTSPPNYPAQEFTLQGANNTRLKLGLDVLCPFEPSSCPLGDGLMNANMDFVQFINPFTDVSCANSPSCDVKFEICVGLNPDSCDLMMRTEIIPSQYNRAYHRSISDTQGSYNFYVTGLYQVIYVNVTACLSSSGYCDSLLDAYSLKYESPASYPALNFTLQGTNDTRLKLGFDVSCPIQPLSCPLADGLMNATMEFIQFTNPFSDVSCANSPSCDVKFEICVGLIPDSCDLMMRTEIISSQYNRGYLRNMSDTQGSYDFYVIGLYQVIYVNVMACLSSSGDCDSVLDKYSLKYNSPANYPAQEFTLQGANNTRLKLGFDVACPIEPPACPLNDGETYANMNFVQFTNPFNNVSCANSSSCNVKFEICVGLNPDSCDLMTRTEIISSQYNRGYLRNISDTQGSYNFYVTQGLYQGIYVNVTACLSSSGDCDSVLDTYSLKYNSSANYPPQNFALQGANNTRLTLEMDMLCPSVPSCSRNEILEVGIWLIRWDMFTNSVSYNLPCFPDNSFCAADVEICIGYPAVPRDCQLVNFRSGVMNDGRKIIFNKTLPHYTTYTSDLENPIYISFNRTRGINIFITLYNIDGNPTPFTIDKFNFEMPDQVITFNNTRIMIKNGTRPADKTQLQLGITYGCKEIPIIPVTLPTTTVVTQTTPTTTPTTTTTQPTTTTTTATSTTTPFLCKFNQFSLTLVNYSNPTNDRSTISPGGCDDIPGDYCDLYFEICLGRIGLNDSCGYAGGAIISPVLAENTQLVFPIVSKTAAEIAADTTVWRNPIIVNIQEVWQSVTMLIRVWDSDPDKPTGQNPWDDVDVFFIPVQDEPIVTRKYESAKGRREGVPPTTLGYEIFNKCLYDCNSGDSLECQQPDANTLLCGTERWRCPKLCGLC